MIATLKEKQVKNCTSPTAKALVLIDLGNGDVKALGKINGTDRGMAPTIEKSGHRLKALQ